MRSEPDELARVVQPQQQPVNAEVRQRQGPVNGVQLASSIAPGAVRTAERTSSGAGAAVPEDDGGRQATYAGRTRR